MRKAIGIAALMSALAFSTAAFAGGVSDCAPGQNAAGLEAYYAGTGSPTPGGTISNLGGAISGGFYGNTSNAGANGHGVTPSLSPGPQAMPDPVPGTGTSVGDEIHIQCP